MAKLTIGNRTVTVDDAFLKLSPEEQSRAVDEIAARLGAGTAERAIVGEMPPEATMGAMERVSDVGKGFGVGLGNAAIGMAGLPGDVQSLIQAGAEYITPPKTVGPSGDAVPVIPVPRLPNSAEIKGAVEEATGPFYEPQTRAGRQARVLGEFAPGAVAPGTLARRLVGGVVAPAVASEAAGEYFKGTPLETPARIGGGIVGGLGGSGAVTVANAARSGVPGMPRGASRVLERTVAPGAEARFAELGPDAFLFEGAPGSFQVAQGVASRPSPGADRLVTALTERERGNVRRIRSDTTGALGPYQDPSIVERALKGQREVVAKEYNAAVQGAQRIDAQPIVRRIDQDIDVEAGLPKKTLGEIKGYLFKQQRFKDANGEWQTKQVLKTSAEELLNVRQAIDDLISRTAEPNTLRLASKYRAEVDKMMPPEVKAVDTRFAELARQSDALQRGQSVLRTGPEAPTVEGLRHEMATSGPGGAPMSPGQRGMLAIGARADIERAIGTKANDVAALRSYVGGEGDWNRAKLSQIFGQDQADKIIASANREAAFQDAYRKLTQNSQTVQRQLAAKLIDDETRPPPMTDLTVLGSVVGGPQWLYRKGMEVLAPGRQQRLDDTLADALRQRGDERDVLVEAIRAAQARKGAKSTTTRDELVRLLFGAEAASTPYRLRGEK